MIIRTHVDISTLTSAPKKAEVKSDAIVEEVKPIRNEEIVSKKRKKSAPIAIEEPIVVEEEKTEDEDLSKWLEEHTED
jgi:hypothetical protein